MTGITNPLNSNEPIRKSRDTQELPNKEGKEVCRLFEIPIKEGGDDLDGDEEGLSESSEDILNPQADKPAGASGALVYFFLIQKGQNIKKSFREKGKTDGRGTQEV